MLSVVLMTVTYADCYIQVLYAKCHCAECCFDESCGANLRPILKSAGKAITYIS